MTFTYRVYYEEFSATFGVRRGYKLIHAKDEAEAREKFKKKYPDLWAAFVL